MQQNFVISDSVRVYLFSTMVLTSLLGLILLMVGELFAGLLAIAIAIGLGLFPIWHILRKELGLSISNQTQMIRTTELLEQLMSSGIDEKISMFHSYENFVKTWNRKDSTNPLYIQQKSMIDKLKADVRAVSKLASLMTPDQKEVSHGVLRRIMDALIEKGFEDEAGEIEDAVATIFAS